MTEPKDRSPEELQLEVNRQAQRALAKLRRMSDGDMDPGAHADALSKVAAVLKNTIAEVRVEAAKQAELNTDNLTLDQVQALRYLLALATGTLDPETDPRSAIQDHEALALSLRPIETKKSLAQVG